MKKIRRKQLDLLEAYLLFFKRPSRSRLLKVLNTLFIDQWENLSQAFRSMGGREFIFEEELKSELLRWKLLEMILLAHYKQPLIKNEGLTPVVIHKLVASLSSKQSGAAVLKKLLIRNSSAMTKIALIKYLSDNRIIQFGEDVKSQIKSNKISAKRIERLAKDLKNQKLDRNLSNFEYPTLDVIALEQVLHNRFILNIGIDKGQVKIPAYFALILHALAESSNCEEHANIIGYYSISKYNLRKKCVELMKTEKWTQLIENPDRFNNPIKFYKLLSQEVSRINNRLQKNYPGILTFNNKLFNSKSHFVVYTKSIKMR